jgi:hypothetical protein
MTLIDRELAILEMAAASGGYVTVGQAVATGFTRSEVRTRCDNGTWARAGTGLIRLPEVESDDLWRDRVRKAVVASGEYATAARYTAARWLLLAGAPTIAPIQIAVPPERHPVERPGVKIARTILTDDDVVYVDGIAVTSPLRTVVDCARYGDHVAAVCLIESAVRLECVTPQDVAAAIAAVKGQRGSARAAYALQRVDLRSESPLETRVRLLLLDDGLPYPELQLEFAVNGVRGRIDLAYRCSGEATFRGLAIEADGREAHTREEAFHRDPIRQTALEEGGYLVRRFTDRHVDMPGYVTRTVRRAFDRVGLAAD